jgi:N-acetylmuramoyl-L-alanine amidase
VIVLLAYACALQAITVAPGPAASPRVLTVRVPGARSVPRVPLVSRADGQLAVRADLLAAALGGGARRLPNGHFIVEVPGAALDFADESGFAASSVAVVPLPIPAWVTKGVLYLPLAVVADVLPRVATGVLYDPAKTEIRLFAALPPHSGHRLASRDVGVPLTSVTRIAEPTSAQSLGSGTREMDADTVGVSPTGDVLLGERDEGPQSGQLPGRRRLVVVDAGHGGPDNGMKGPIGSSHPLYEKNLALAVALRVGTALRRHGIDVFQTRTRDTLIALSDRGRIANEHHGDLFLSIHVNAANPNWHDPAAARGFETYFLAEAKTEDALRVERMENEAVRFETGADASANDPLNFIIHDMAQNEHLRESSELAGMIQHALGRVHPGPDRGVKQAGFMVLVRAYMPAVLVEIGFGTNAAEARYLADPSSQTTIASAIASATADYLARYERRVSAVGQ